MSFNQYLGARKCCDLKVQGPQGYQGATGPSAVGSMGYQGATGVTGPQGATGRGCRGDTGAQGATGVSQWTSMNGVGGSTGGYTGIGITGQDVLIYGNLLVTGGIDPTYLALTPQPNGPQGFINPLWVDISSNLRSQNIYLDNPAGIGNTGAYIDINPISEPQITLSDNTPSSALNIVTFNNNQIILKDGITGEQTASLYKNGLYNLYSGVSGFNQSNISCISSESSILLGYNNLLNNTQNLQIKIPDATSGNTSIKHEFTGGIQRDLELFTNANLLVASNNLTLDPNVLTVLGTNALPQEGVEIGKNIITISDVSSTGYTSDPCLRLINRNTTIGATAGVPTIQSYKNGRIANVNDVIFSQQFNAKDYIGGAKTFGKIECSVTNNSATNNIDGALDFYSCVDGNNNIVFRMNGADNDNNCFRPLDMAGGGLFNTIKTSNGNLSITTATSIPGAVLTLATKDNAAGSGDGLALTGNTLLSNLAGASSGKFLALTIGGTVYKIALLNAN
jgi:hypothetical protein